MKGEICLVAVAEGRPVGDVLVKDHPHCGPKLFPEGAKTILFNRPVFPAPKTMLLDVLFQMR